MNEKLFKSIADELLEYFFAHPEGDLEILDGGEDQAGYGVYAGVTLSYIHKYVLKLKYNKNSILYVLRFFLDKDWIAMNYCTYAENMVFYSQRDKYDKKGNSSDDLFSGWRSLPFDKDIDWIQGNDIGYVDDAEKKKVKSLHKRFSAIDKNYKNTSSKMQYNWEDIPVFKY